MNHYEPALTTLRDLFLQSAHLYGERIAVRSGDRESSYRDLLDRGTRVANALLALGAQRGDRVVAFMPDCIEALELHVGVAIGGFTLVPVNHRFKSEELDYVLSDCGARALVHATSVNAVVDTLDATDVIRIAIGADDVSPGSHRYDELVEAASTHLPADRPEPDGIAMIGYTSGTTGFPKGAMLTHRGGMLSIRASLNGFRHPLYGQCAYTGSLAFVALVWAFVYTHLHNGGTVTLLGPGFDAEQWFDVMERDRSTFTYAPTPLVPAFVEMVEQRPHVLDHLETVCHSASPLSRPQRVELVEAVGGRYVETWGMTESLASVTATTRSDHSGVCAADDIYSTVGRPVPPARVVLIDADGNEMPPGTEGEFEIAIDSPTLFSGYWGQPEKTAEVLSNGRFRTGDIGRIDRNGYLYLLSRANDVIISGGINVYPAEVERVLDEHPAIAESAVVGVPHETWGEAVVAAVVLEPGLTVDEADVIEHARGRLASYKKPTRVVVVDALPRNTNLKVQKSVVREWLAR